MLLKIVCHLDYSSCCTSFPNWTPHSTSAMMQKTQPKSTKTATKPTKKSTKDNQNKTKTEKQSNVLNSMLLSRAFNYTGLPSQIFFLSSFLFFFLYFWKLYSSRTEEHICFCGFLEVQQQLWSGISVSRAPEHILCICKIHPYSTCRARQMPPGSFGAMKHAAHRQCVYAEWIHGVHDVVHRAPELKHGSHTPLTNTIIVRGSFIKGYI